LKWQLSLFVVAAILLVALKYTASVFLKKGAARGLEGVVTEKAA